VLLLCACEANRAELAAVEAHVDAQLAMWMRQADGLNARRREVDVLEDRLRKAIAALPAGVDAGEPPEPPAPAPTLPPLEPPLPRESTLEGASGARVRARIEEKRRRLGELERVLREVERIEREKVRLERKLEWLEKVGH
jgi:hypothetical protein